MKEKRPKKKFNFNKANKACIKCGDMAFYKSCKSNIKTASAYYFEYYWKCQKCSAIYMDNESKVWKDNNCEIFFIYGEKHLKGMK